MGTGLIFAILVVGWLAYLIPWFVSRRGQFADDAVDLQGPQQFTESTRVVRRSSDPLGMGEDDPELEVSTPLTRRAALVEIRACYANAARRRQRTMISLVTMTIATAVAAPLSPLPWWSVLVPAGLLVAFVVVARFSVVTLTRQLDERAALLEAASDEETVMLQVEAAEHSAELSIELSAPVGATGSLWDAVPVTQPTYVSKPLVPRTVRTIDLSAPAAPERVLPVTADRPVEADDDQVENTEVIPIEKRAVGE